MGARVDQGHAIIRRLHTVEYSHQAMTDSTRERLLRAAQQLFAERGYDATSVGDIEEAASFTRRGGTMYRHFASKQAILTELIDQHRAALSDTASPLGLLPLGDPKAEMRLVARAVLAEIDTEKDIHRILDASGGHVPDAREEMLARVIEPSYASAAKVLRTWTDVPLGDEAAAQMMILVGGLINTRRNLWTFGRVPLNLTDEQLVEAFVSLASALCLAVSEPDQSVQSAKKSGGRSHDRPRGHAKER
jgi:AcrR family transcriptional regulator